MEKKQHDKDRTRAPDIGSEETMMLVRVFTVDFELIRSVRKELLTKTEAQALGNDYVRLVQMG